MAKGWDKFIEDRWDEFFNELVDEIQEQSDGEISKKEAEDLIIHWMKT
jgi:hypothetical protein